MVATSVAPSPPGRLRAAERVVCGPRACHAKPDGVVVRVVEPGHVRLDEATPCGCLKILAACRRNAVSIKNPVADLTP